MFRKLYNQRKFEVVLGARCYCPDHGIMENWNIGMNHNSEVGMRNSERREKGNAQYIIPPSALRIPKSLLTHYSIIPEFQ